MKQRYTLLATCWLLLVSGTVQAAEHSVARRWNEVLLESIRGDYARPTVHARNLFHTSSIMYDAWAVYDPIADPYLLGHTVGGFFFPFEGVPTSDDPRAAQEKAMSYAAYRLISHRFQASPGKETSRQLCDDLMEELGYDTAYHSLDYVNGEPAALGNYLAAKIIEFGLQDGSNESQDHRNLFYRPLNQAITPSMPGNPTLRLPNNWQPLTLQTYIDQSGNEVPGTSIPFLSPEWGNVVPFAMTEADKTTLVRNWQTYQIYHDPGPPPLIQFDGEGMSSEYKWGFSLVSVWSAHLDPSDGVMWDISPASLGNIEDLPTEWEAFRDFYDLTEGGDPSMGHEVNPHTGQPYPTNLVPRGDYTRVLAEFWADGPDSETPPGHWFTILNYVSDHPELIRKFKGEGQVLTPLEWDVKSYFILGGAMHDAAISAWGIKGYYDYLRPVSAIRWMAGRGQNSDPDLPNFSNVGIPLVPGFIEQVQADDPLVGDSLQHLHKIKVLAWKGPDYISDPETDQAGVDWILAENWWPYQRPTFVTPPFAGYVSGHSTYSRAAAEVLTLLTGDPYFPGGVGEFIAKKDEFLVFEEGPSVDVILQWATYRDASDQTSLSRIWGGIHPPADDIPGRIIGKVIGPEAFTKAEAYFTGEMSGRAGFPVSSLYPNPISPDEPWRIAINEPMEELTIWILNLQGQSVYQHAQTVEEDFAFFTLPFPKIARGMYVVQLAWAGKVETRKIWVR
ncbi:MAG: DUF6851 domain-containing protein [Bacteroidota bacterium]